MFLHNVTHYVIIAAYKTAAISYIKETTIQRVIQHE